MFDSVGANLVFARHLPGICLAFARHLPGVRPAMGVFEVEDRANTRFAPTNLKCFRNELPRFLA